MCCARAGTATYSSWLFRFSAYCTGRVERVYVCLGPTHSLRRSTAGLTSYMSSISSRARTSGGLNHSLPSYHPGTVVSWSTYEINASSPQAPENRKRITVHIYSTPTNTVGVYCLGYGRPTRRGERYREKDMRQSATVGPVSYVIILDGLSAPNGLALSPRAAPKNTDARRETPSANVSRPLLKFKIILVNFI